MRWRLAFGVGRLGSGAVGREFIRAGFLIDRDLLQWTSLIRRLTQPLYRSPCPRLHLLAGGSNKFSPYPAERGTRNAKTPTV